MKMKISKRAIMLFAILVLVSIIAVYFFQVTKEHFASTVPLPKTVTLKGCDTDPIPNLVCPSGYVVTNATVNYGRFDDLTCVDKTVKKGTKASTTATIPMDSYKNQNIAKLGGNFSKFIDSNKDPVKGMKKQFVLNGTCKQQKTTVSNDVKCDYKKIPNLSCPPGYVVENAAMKYGRWNNEGCNDNVAATPDRFKMYNLPASRWASTKTYVQLGNTAQTLANKDDPARGAQKQYQVTANCKLA